MSTRLRWIIGFLTLLCAVLFVREWSLSSDGRLHIAFQDVGQGDSELITLPDGRHILIDGGPDWSALERLGEELPFFDRRIDLMIVTHSDLDHHGSFPEVLRRYDVGSLLIAVPGTAGRYQSMIAAAQSRHVPISTLNAGTTLDFGGTTMTVLWPPKELPKEFHTKANNESIVLRLEHDGKRVLLTGDAEAIVEKTLVAAKADLRADILKVGHHGSNTSSSTGFLLAVHPSMSVISVGEGNPFHHPRPEIVKRLEEFGGEVKRTDRQGTIEVSW